jgi:hypothetical protein
MNPAKSFILLAIVFAVSLVIAGFCAAGDPTYNDLQSTGLFKKGHNFSESIDMLFDVEQGGALSLGTTNGSVRIKTWSKDQIRLVVTKTTAAESSFNAQTILEDFLVQARHKGKDLHLTAMAYSETCRSSVGVTFTVWVPKNYNVAIDTGDGNVDIGKINGSFSAKTAKGKITFECEPNGMDIEVRDKTGATDEATGISENGATEALDPAVRTSSPGLKGVGTKK